MKKLGKRAGLAGAAIVAAALAAASPAGASGRTGPREAWASPDLDADGDVRVVVMLRAGLPAEAAARRGIRRPAEVRLRRSFGHLGGEVVKVRPERLADLVSDLEADPDVLFAEPDRLDQRVLAQRVPWGITRIHADPASRGVRSGAGVKVAVIDTGVWFSPATGAVHPDLAAVYSGGYDFVNGDAVPGDLHGHGTHVAGTVAAVDNRIGVIGAAPGVRLYALKAVNDNGLGYFSDFIAALDWCVANGVRIANYSVGGEYASPAVEEACRRARAAGVTVVAAAGNRGVVGYPAVYASVIAVGATDPWDATPSWSGVGDALDLVAPGVGVSSTYLDGRYAVLDGTSMAAPHVAGAAALLAGRGISDPDIVQAYLEATATDLSNPGRDHFSGSGLVDAGARLPARPLIAAPLTGESLASGTVYRIDWDPVAGAAAYRVLFLPGGAGPWKTVVAATARTARLWRVPPVTVPLPNCRVQVAAYGAGGRLLGVNTVRRLTLVP